MHMLRQGQLRGIGKGDSLTQAAFVAQALGLVA